jgi:hypothetical protein
MEIKNDRIIKNQSSYFATDKWNYSNEGYERFYFGAYSTTYYKGYTGDVNHEFRNNDATAVMKLRSSGTLDVTGYFSCKMPSVANDPNKNDYIGVQINTSQGTAYTQTLRIMNATFTGFHRCFTDDIEFQDNMQLFKDTFYGRIVISTGKIKTDTNKNNNWNILYNKEGITTEDAIPVVKLSQKKKDKRVFGVYGSLNRNNSRPERLIINSVGEGGIWICNSNSNIKNGDYITSSDYLGYGEKQDDDLLHNYTVAKATIDCNFELESIYYNCIEIENLDMNGNKLRVAFIAATYHCG